MQECEIKPSESVVIEYCINSDLIKKFIKIDSNIDDNVIEMIRSYVVNYVEKKIEKKFNLSRNKYKISNTNIFKIRNFNFNLLSIFDEFGNEIKDFSLKKTNKFITIQLNNENVKNFEIHSEEGFGEKIDDTLKYKMLNHILYCYENRGIDFSLMENDFYSFSNTIRI